MHFVVIFVFCDLLVSSRLFWGVCVGGKSLQKHCGINNPSLSRALPLAACRWQCYLCNETDGKGALGSLAIIWKADRNCTQGTPVRWPPGLRLRDSWWN